MYYNYLGAKSEGRHYVRLAQHSEQAKEPYNIRVYLAQHSERAKEP
jgi:hypothetical protein